MGGHHRRPRGNVADSLRYPDAASSHLRQDGFVVDEIAEDGERLTAGGVEGEVDGVANAEAHTKVFCAEEFHGIRRVGN